MNRTLITAAIIGFVILAPGVSHADDSVTATCDSITVTSTDTGSTLLGIDAEPPMNITAGTTVAYPFPQDSESHHWTVTVIADGPWTGDPQFANGDVAGCTVQSDPYQEMAHQVTAPWPKVEVVSPWANVELAPPW